MMPMTSMMEKNWVSERAGFLQGKGIEGEGEEKREGEEWREEEGKGVMEKRRKGRSHDRT